MRRVSAILFAFLLCPAIHGATENWPGWLVPELRQVEHSRRAAELELQQLGAPLVGQSATESGYQRQRVRTPPLTPDWIQIDLRKSQRIDFIALVPMVLDWNSADPPAYAFPLRFQVAISDDARFQTFTLVTNCNEQDFPNPGIAPVSVPVGGKTARYVRVSVTKLPETNERFSFSLSEIMVLSGNLDIAASCPVRATASIESPPHFSRDYVVDGMTHLGPPIREAFVEWDGLHAGEISNVIPPFMALDLGREYPLQQIRIFPTHARLGADIPGFRFPANFTVEASDTPKFNDPILLFKAENFSNPGDNPVTIPVDDVPARYVRVSTHFKDRPGGPRFSLSELQVYSDNTNVALGAKVMRTPDHFPGSRAWPTSILVDGYTSYGKLMELPEWLAGWSRRLALKREIAALDQRQAELAVVARQRVDWLAVGMVSLGLVAASGFWITANIRIRRKLYAVQARLARDIHDHVGSNLAGIAVLSEVAGSNSAVTRGEAEDWVEVNHIARETIEVMKEVIWLVGDKKGPELDLMRQLHLAATRMLAGREFHWESVVTEIPDSVPVGIRRDIFLFFKEALTNVVRHSNARRVQLRAEVSSRRFQLSVVDDGCGFDPKTVRHGVGLNSLRMRTHAVGGSVKIVSSPGQGTGVYLTIPLGRLRKHLRFFNRWRNA